MDFHNFSTIYVFEVKESIVDILTELRCLSHLDNPSQVVVVVVVVENIYKAPLVKKTSEVLRLLLH